MSEIYWITRLDVITFVSILICVFSGLAAVVFFFLSMDELSSFGETNDYKSQSKVARKALAVFLIALSVSIFCPTQKDMYAIWGIGGTIDYIKSNDKAKELPDKVIDALDRYIDSIAGDDSN